MKPHIAVSLLLSVIALAVMCWQLFDPGHVDGWVLGLLGIAFLPWLWQIIESVGFPGGSIKFRELQEKQEHQEDEIRALRFLVANFLKERSMTTSASSRHQKPLDCGRARTRPHFSRRRNTCGGLALCRRRPT